MITIDEEVQEEQPINEQSSIHDRQSWIGVGEKSKKQQSPMPYKPDTTVPSKLLICHLKKIHIISSLETRILLQILLECSFHQSWAFDWHILEPERLFCHDQSQQSRHVM